MTVVVRRNCRWIVTSEVQPGADDVALGQVLELIAAADERSGLDARAAGFAPLPADLRLEPGWIATATLAGDGLVGTHPSERPVLWTAEDLVLIDSLRWGAPVGEVAAATGIADAPQRLARLLDAGVVRTPVVRAEPSPTEAPRPALAPTGSPAPGGPSGRIPVYAVWHPHVGPLLALGMLTASLRRHRDGALNERFEIRRPETAESFLADLATRTGPAVLLSSDYVWSLDHNLAVARQARALNPELVVIHGGPSCPKYEGDAQRFLDDHGDVADVLTRGEGEHLVCELFDSLAASLPGLDEDALAQIEGLTFRRTDGAIVRTEDAPRIVDLDALPSPYLTGEFDHIDAASWNTCLSVETSRGCPYSCSFCDWGSATLSRIRKFSLERVAAEVEWAAVRGVAAVNLPDANFGIMSRDVETARIVADIKARFGRPTVLVFYPAKNTTKHFIKIMDIIGEAGISSAASLSLQTTDATTLAALDRSNISTEHFVKLAADYRRRGHPLQGDLLVGIPGQTGEKYRKDLQFMFDHEILVRTWPVQILPNAPMNAPEYRSEHGIVSDERNLVMAATSFTTDDRARMLRLRRVDLVTERYGVLRHVLRWLQWDQGIEATAVMDRIVSVMDDDPSRYPYLSWLLLHFADHATAPGGWRNVTADARRFLATELGVGPSSALDAVLALNQFLMPTPGRRFPDTLDLAHDYVAYYRSATASLYGDGTASLPVRPLAEFGPGSITVESDLLGLSTHGIVFDGDSWNEVSQGEFQIGSSIAHELISPLTRLLPGIGALGIGPAWIPDDVVGDDDGPAFLQDVVIEGSGEVAQGAAVPVTLGVRR